MKSLVFVLVFIIVGCNNKSPKTIVDYSIDSLYESPNDSLDKMMEFISYVDSSGLVEKVSNDFVELKETNEKLETTLEETKQELQETKEELVETKVTLEKAEKIVKAVTGDSSTNATGFELLPIKK